MHNTEIDAASDKADVELNRIGIEEGDVDERSEAALATADGRDPPSSPTFTREPPDLTPVTSGMNDIKEGHGVAKKTLASVENADPSEKEPLHQTSENDADSKDLQIPTGRDGGYGWLVVFATFGINVIVAGYIKSFGLIYAPIKERYPATSTVVAGLMMGLLSGCRGILSPVIGAFCVIVGPRVCSILGSLLMAAGLLLSIPGVSAIYLAFTIGAVVGVGACMSETPAPIIVSEYFLEKRSTANGLRTAGNAFGGFVFPFLVMFILAYQPIQGYFIITAGIVLQICVLGMLYRPFEVHQQVTQERFLEDLRKKPEDTDDYEAYRKAVAISKSSKKEKKKKPLNLALFKNPAYVIYIIMMALNNIAVPTVLMYMPLFGRYKGLTELENSIIISVLSILDFFCRMLLGWLSDKKIYAKRHGFVFGLTIAGSSLSLLPLAYNLWTVLAIMWMRSVGIAMFWALINGLLADQFGSENMATSWGFVRMTQGVTNFLYPPLLGAVADATGSMSSPFILMGCMQLMAAIVFAMQPLVIRLTGVDVKLT